MSVSLYNSYPCDTDFGMLRFATETKMHHQQNSAISPSVPRAKLDHVRRNLFGPVDRKECSRFAQEELAKHQMSASQKWGFDFVRGCPLDDASLYLWERVPPTNEIPEMYTLSRAAHIRPIEPIDRTPSKKRRNHQRRNSYFDLYDEMVEESNRYNPPKRNLLDLSFEDVDDSHTPSSSCDEESFEEDNYDENLAWMPNPEKLNSKSIITTAPITTTAATITTTVDNTNCGDGHQMTNDAEQASQLDTCSTIIQRSCDTSCNDKHVKLTSNHTINATQDSPRILRNSPRIRERQFKITDFLKERKRLQPSVKKVSPKKQRNSPPSGTILAHFGTQHQ